jgi:hypothetical protein
VPLFFIPVMIVFWVAHRGSSGKAHVRSLPRTHIHVNDASGFPLQRVDTLLEE